MKVTKFSKKHIHVLNTLFAKLCVLFNYESNLNFRSLNPLIVHIHEKTVVVKFNENAWIREILMEHNLDNLYGKAVCSESDKFDIQTGVKIARTKLFKALMMEMHKQAREQIIRCQKVLKSFHHIYREKMDESNMYMDQLSSDSVE